MNNLEQRKQQILDHKGKMVKHFKGKQYLIVDFAIDTETNNILVIYKALYGKCELYARPLEMFISEVDHEKYPDVQQKWRFEIIEN